MSNRHHSSFAASRTWRLPRALLSCALPLLLSATALQADFTISGALPQLPQGATLQLLREDLDQRTRVTVATWRLSSKGRFHKTFEEEAGYFSLALPDGKKIPLAISPAQKLLVFHDSPHTDGFAFSGSTDTQELRAYDTFRKESLARLVYPPRAALNAANNSKAATEERLVALAQAEVDGYVAHRRELNDFIIDEMSPTAALYATSLRWDGNHRFQELSDKVNAFASLHPDLKISQSMQARIALEAATAIGQKAPALQGTGIDGKKISLADFKGKIVLVDFWASWCVPCRVENKHYRDLREKYPKSEFEILGVNLDESAGVWKIASARDKVDWPQISDGLGWQSPLATAYGVSALPISYLLDANGRIIAKGLRGPNLEAVLDARLENSR